MTDQPKKKAGHPFSPNPRKIRVTYLVTPAEFEALQAAAQKLFEGNLSTMTRRFVFEAIATMSTIKEP